MDRCRRRPHNRRRDRRCLVAPDAAAVQGSHVVDAGQMAIPLSPNRVLARCRAVNTPHAAASTDQSHERNVRRPLLRSVEDAEQPIVAAERLAASAPQSVDLDSWVRKRHQRSRSRSTITARKPDAAATG